MHTIVPTFHLFKAYHLELLLLGIYFQVKWEMLHSISYNCYIASLSLAPVNHGGHFQATITIVEAYGERLL